jgi:hypothetical protein
MKIGLYYQSGYRYVACYHALNQFRKFYPDAPIALYEDNTDLLLPIAKKFNCDYKKTTIGGYNDPHSGRPAFDLKSMKAWFNRVYEACTTVLSEVDWIVHFEDDVWFKRPLKGIPPSDLNGIGGRGWNEKLYEYLETNVRGAHGCGGSIFNRLKFIEAYQNINKIDWDLIDELAVDPKPSQWTDSALTFLFLYSKMSVSGWSELSQYRNDKFIDKGNPRDAWEGSIEELEDHQGDLAVIHCWKPYYFPTQEEIDFVENDLKNFTS